MLDTLKRLLFIASLLAVSPLPSRATPSAGRLLALVPPDAAVVAGVEDPHNPIPYGHHLLVTVANSLELDDWVALTGVDSHRAVDQLIWLAASSPRGGLREHALLVAGTFDRQHIFQAARQNGASTTWYEQIESLVIQPFAREQSCMGDVRWLAILDEHTAVFGTPWLVQRAIDRLASRASADPRVLTRIARLHDKANSWTLLALPADPAARRAAISQLPRPWSDLVRNAGEITLGIRYGSTTRIDFSIELAVPPPGGSTTPQGGLPLDPAWLQSAQIHVENLVTSADRLEGSLSMSQKQFETSFQKRFPPVLADAAK